MSSEKPISDKTIERLSLYRRLLNYEFERGVEYIYSHELAKLADITPAQVRRDLMVLNLTGNPNRGYDIKNLIEEISHLLGSAQTINVAIVGVGNLGKAVISYFAGKREDLPIVAAFDNDLQKVGTYVSGCKCYSLEEFKQRVDELHIRVVLLAVPHDVSKEVTTLLVDSGVKSIVNFTHVPLHVPEDVHVENVDITTSIEKAAYFVKH